MTDIQVVVREGSLTFIVNNMIEDKNLGRAACDRRLPRRRARAPRARATLSVSRTACMEQVSLSSSWNTCEKQRPPY